MTTREQFEQFAIKHEFPVIRRLRSDEYRSPEVEFGWQCWKASRDCAILEQTKREHDVV